MACSAYPRNTVYYNPAVTYLPWMKADGICMANTPYNAAFGSFNLASGTKINLGSASSCGNFSLNSSSSKDEDSDYYKVCGGLQTFFVPKDTTQTGNDYLSVANNYYRYQIELGGSDIKRSEYGTVGMVGAANCFVGGSRCKWDVD